MAYLYKAAGSSVNYSHSLDQQPDPQEFHMHAHDVFEIYFFIAGNGTYAVESTIYPLRPGLHPAHAPRRGTQAEHPPGYRL